MNVIMWIVAGGLIGWVASIVMKTNERQGIVLNVIVGIVGAFLAAFFLVPFLGTGTINHNDFSLSSLLVSFVGAVILLGILNLFRRGAVR